MSVFVCIWYPMRGPKASTNIFFFTATTIANNSFNCWEKILFPSFTYDLPKPRCFVQTMLPCFDPVVGSNVLRYLNLKWSQLRPDGLEFFSDFLHFLSIGFVCTAVPSKDEIARRGEQERNREKWGSESKTVCMHSLRPTIFHMVVFFSYQCEYNFSQQLIVIFLI